MRPLYGRVGFLDVLFFWTFYLTNKSFQCSWQWLLPFMSYEFKTPFNLKWITYFGYLLLILRFSSFNPIQDGHFRGCSRMGGAKRPPSLKSVTHIISYNDETLHSYTLPKEDPRNIWITWHTSWVLLTSGFFHRKSANLVISRNADINWILIHNF